ncbi:three-Cys-motif partner protein TcmP [Prochlorothrix hollandica]|uniref:Three-Cys-motif partner protein TcmP n=1 Tax=Prochlorothrix hollandica PCC 9006 = CALU 1027 TaxID=317619 RepID=A0A0M2PXJ9_PROHO|nr:three-Cys-motif partner protein TcmP [Prochlorothrix hollandica]KKJ00890.1 hypothetical protein PROH_00050 [Prochlorothrix hollandica PCC 9006 = CALU 1027]
MVKASWSSDGSTIPDVEAHTKAKHKILETYVEELIVTLYGKGRYGSTKFTFVDGFCGGGIYRDPEDGQIWAGSPVRIFQAVNRGVVKSQRKYDIDVQYIFIDSKQEHIDCLKKYTLPYFGLEKEAEGHNVKFMCDDFESVVNQCCLSVDIHKGHSFFFLDPFGWTDVSMASIRKIRRLKKSEILFTYMIDYIERFIEQRFNQLKSNFTNILEADGFYTEAKPSRINEIGEQCYLRNESMRLFREKGEYPYVFTFSLIPRNNSRVLYYLIHMSQELTALEVMKASFWGENTLDYQYYFEIYGYGFKTSDYYQANQGELKFDINPGADQFCINRLDASVMKIIHNCKSNELTFRELCEITIQENPATRQHYEELITLKRSEQDITVLRDGRKTTAKNLQWDDVIKVSDSKQLFLFP